MYPSFKRMIKSQLSVDSLREVGLDIKGKMLITNGYIQQLYRFFRLSPFVSAKPFELACNLRELLVYRLVVVGERAQQSINQLLN